MLVATPVCPKCGGEAAGAKPGELYTCKFCGATATLEAPPPVVHQTIVQSEVVQRVVLVDPTSGKTSLKCPRCSVALFEGLAAEAILHGCGACGGIWLDNAASSRIVNAVQPGLTAMSDKAARAKKVDVDAKKPAQCPIDGAPLERVDVKGVEVDVCKVHGTWFDAGEVRRVGEAFQSARISMAGGATYDYGAAAAESLDSSRKAQAVMSVLGGILAAVATGSSTRR
jgi:Zn-finger nucleic acid-binding protein